MQTTQFQHALKYSLYTGGSIILFFLIIYIFGMVNNPSIPNIALFIFVAGVYISVKRYRDFENSGILSFGKAYGTAILTVVFTGILWAGYEYVLYKFLSPGLFDTRIEEMQEIWLNKGFSEELIELQSTIFSPLILAISYVFSSAFWGAILAFPVAALLKRDKNPINEGSQTDQ